MNRCIELAGKGLGNVAPNPMVGCVIVYHGEIVGEGYHTVFGGPHAEVNAINSVKEKDILKDCDLYVNLEPCSHYGKTPPCADLIIKCGIPRVFIGTRDPYAEVQGRGVARLKEAGIVVTEDILVDKCKDLNKRFFTFHQKIRPFVILKWAQTIDGFIDHDRNNCEPQINWITDEHTRILVHRWRSEEQSILIGTNTVMFDDPQLTVRDWHGKNPLRLVIDEKLSIPSSFKIFDSYAETIVFNAVKNAVVCNIEYVKLDFSKSIIPQILVELHRRNIQSLIVEGGRMLLQSFIDEDYWDEARVFSGNICFFKGIKSPEICGNMVSVEPIVNDKLMVIKNLNQQSVMHTV